MQETKRTSWNKGLKLSKEHREKLSISHNGKNGYWKGKKRPEMSGSNNPNSGKFGKNHPCWKESKKRTFDKSLRNLFKYRQWRSDIFTRDDFTCVLCGKHGCYLEADHYPQRFSEIIIEYNITDIEKALSCEKLWDLNNGRTLCKECHNPTKGRYKKT